MAEITSCRRRKELLGGFPKQSAKRNSSFTEFFVKTSPKVSRGASEEGVGDFAREQTLAVLREHHHIPNRVVHVQDPRTIRTIAVIELIHQHPLATHRMDHLQQQRTQQLLPRDRWPPSVCVRLAEPDRSARNRTGAQP